MRDTHITMAHGGGGKAMRELIDALFIANFGGEGVEDQARLHAQALQQPGARLAFTTDSFVVHPVEFTGGDIGRIAVCGTVNDLAVGGARPLWLSAAFILEEGVEIALLRRLVTSMQQAAGEAGVKIVTGDTKVVERGSADQVFITTAGVGVIAPGCDLRASAVRAGDVALISGPLGDHGASIMAARGDLALHASLCSDAQPLGEVMAAVQAAAPGLRCARDTTRGGLAAALNEIAEASATRLVVQEANLPIRPEVQGLSEILGLDPLYLANEGALVAFVPPDEGEAALVAMRATPAGAQAALIGVAEEAGDAPGRVEMVTTFGGRRLVDRLVGEQLPRIC